MTEDEKNEAIREAVEACLDKAADVLEANQSGVKALFAIYIDEDGAQVHTIGHEMAQAAAYQKVLQYVINDLIQPLKPQERG